MKLTIHRGAKEIGGTCIELQSTSSRILIDFGLPLIDANGESFPRQRTRNLTVGDPAHQGILPSIDGLYDNQNPLFDGILVSHPHPDHYGLLGHVNPSIPVYMSDGCKRLIGISGFFSQTQCDLKNVVTIKPWQPFKIGDFGITPYLVDHSGFDALAFLIEGEGKRIFYSGDFRGHGRKKVLFDHMTEKPLPNIDYLILEGTTIGRDPVEHRTELDVENELLELFRKPATQFFIACSSQNIDRIVSIYRACVRSNRIFVMDPYTAFVLHELRSISRNIPQFDWEKNIQVFFIPNGYTKRLAADKSLFTFRSAKISYAEMQRMRTNLVIKDSFAMREYFARKNGLVDTTLIYSLWEGYLPEDEDFWTKNKVPITKVHVSGHAYVEDLKKLAAAMKPQYIIPNHTLYPDQFARYFGTNVRLIKDGEPIKL